MKQYEELLSYEASKKLKELGFDWPCYDYFVVGEDKIARKHNEYPSNVNGWGNSRDLVSNPTLYSALLWLLKKFGYFVEFKRFIGKEIKFGYTIKKEDIAIYFYPDSFEDIEEAIKDSIDKILKDIKK